MMNSNADLALRLVAAAAHEMVDEEGAEIDLARGPDALLYGRGGPLDSLGLVGLILRVEERAADAWGRPFSLADDRALSLRRSPFRTIGSLAEHLCALAGEARAA